MRYALPISADNEIAPLLEAGASEFYCGFQDAAWSGEYGMHDSQTRRQGAANISDADVLRRVAETGKCLHTPVWLAMNGRYTTGQLDRVLSVCENWTRWGGDGIIVRDPVLLKRLSSLPHHPRLTVSLLAVCLNRKAVEFWVSLGADRIVLPRCVQLEEMRSITEAFPSCEFEAMVMADRCLFVDGLCRSIHGCTYPGRIEPAENPVKIQTFDLSGQAHHLCLDCFGSKGGGCAACYLERLEQAGISVGKFGGRGTPLSYRLSLLEFLCKASKREISERPDLHRSTLGDCRCYYDDREA